MFKSIIVIALLSVSTFACSEQTLFNNIYDKHIEFAKEKNSLSYQKLLTKNAISFIDKQVSFFKKQGKNISFIDLVHDSVLTDTPRKNLHTYDCIKKGSKAMVIYIQRLGEEVHIVNVTFKKEDEKWKMNEYAESDILNTQFDAYITHIKNKFK